MSLPAPTPTPTPVRIQPPSICAVVLAGGRGSRMGGVDKGLQRFQGQALALRAVQRLQAQTLGRPGLIAINANRHLDDYAAWGFAVWPDALPRPLPEFSGPLGGILSALEQCQTAPRAFDYLLVVPCDSPHFPLQLLERLAQGLEQVPADLAVAAVPESCGNQAAELRTQPVFCLMRCGLRDSLRAYLAQGGRKIDTWIRQQHHVLVRFDAPLDATHAFANANSLQELKALEQAACAQSATK